MGVSYFFSTKPDVKEFYKNIIAIHLSLFLVWKTLPKAQATRLVFWYFTIFYPPLMVWQAEGMWPPNDIHILTSGTGEWYRSQQGFCRCNEMGQLCWISRISPKCYHKCLSEREAEEDLTPRGEKATWPWRPWSDAAAARECWRPPELEEARNRGLPPELPEGASRGSTILSAPRLQPSDPDVRFLASKTTGEQISVVLNLQICYICSEKLIWMLSIICL